MSPRRLGCTAALSIATGAVLVLGALTTGPAHAASTATWIGLTGNWSDATNWSTGTVPQSGDTVVIQENPGHTVEIDEIGNVTVANLVLAGGENNTRLGADGEGALTVTGSTTWTGGTLGVPLTVPSGGSLTIGSGHDKYFTANGGHIDVAGNAVIDSTGISDGDGLLFWWDSGLRVLTGGTLTSHGQSQLTGNRCCGADFPSTLDIGGTVSVPDGRLSVETMGLSVHGHVHVASGALLADDKGVVRLGDASYDGGGALALTNTVGPSPQPDHPERNQGGALLTGTGTLADGFDIEALAGTEVTGVGTLTGTGDLTVDGSTMYAHLHLGGGVYLENPAGGHATLGVWNPAADGYHGDVDLGAGGTIEPTGHLTIRPGARLSISGGLLDVAAQGVLDSDACCTDTPEVVVGHGGTIAFHGDGPDTTSLMKWLTVASAGTVDVVTQTTWTGDTIRQSGGTTSISSTVDATGTGYTLAGGTMTDGPLHHGTYAGDIVNTGGTLRPGGTLVVRGDYTQRPGGTLAVLAGSTHSSLAVTGTATLAGTLTSTTSGSPAVGTTQRILTAGSRAGSFGCVRTGSWQPAYAATGVRLTLIGVHGTGCEHTTAPWPLTATLTAGKSHFFATSFGPHARQILLQVRLSRATATTKVSVSADGGGSTKVSVRRGHTVTRYLVLRLGTRHRLHTVNATGRVRIRVRELGWYR